MHTATTNGAARSPQVQPDKAARPATSLFQLHFLHRDFPRYTPGSYKPAFSILLKTLHLLLSEAHKAGDHNLIPSH
jgi:hypothetical protein